MTVIVPPKGAPLGPPNDFTFNTGDLWNPSLRQRFVAGTGWVSQPSATATVLTPGSTVSVDPTLGNIFTLTPGEDETITPASQVAGQQLTIIITTSGTSSKTLTFGTGFKAAGTLATGTSDAKVFTITFISNGSVYAELGRTAAM